MFSLHQSCGALRIGSVWRTEHEIPSLLKTNVGIFTKPLLDVFEHSGTKKAHIDVERAAELGADRRRRKSSGGELIGAVALDDFDRALVALTPQEIGDEAADDGAADDDN
ncbi:hypothetical protein D3C76_1265080 [compost metagenome]